jgi:hypothetical protein
VLNTIDHACSGLCHFCESVSSFELNEYVQVFLLFFYAGLAHPHHLICPSSGPRTWILSMSSLGKEI